MSVENRVHEVTFRESMLPSVRHEIEKLNRRARKLDLPELEIIQTGSESRPVEKEIAPGKFVQTGVFEMWVTIQVEGETPKLEGWSFLGTLDHAAGDTVVRNAPGAEIPSDFWSAERVGLCDHCGTKRYRKETFVVRNVETGEYAQVGRQCISDFLGGKSVDRALAVGWWTRRLDEILDEDRDEGPCDGPLWSSPLLLDATRSLAIAVRVVNEYGYMSRAKAQEHEQTTSDRVSTVLWPPPMAGMHPQHQQDLIDELKRLQPTEDDLAKANKIRSWLSELDTDGNSYVFNLQTIVKRDLVQPKELGFLASAVPFYYREIENPKWNPTEKAPASEWIGEIKTRIDIEVECVGISSFEGDYGTTTIYRLKIGDNKLTWFASSTSDIEIGGKYLVKATVKAHDVYKGQQVTLVNRVKVLETISTGTEEAA